jgi:endonuclease/exonuclease/phosphatase (EEP) superfamily protein YafD
VLRIVVWALGLALAVPAVVLTIARLSGSERRMPVQIQAFAPLAVPLYAGLVLLLVVVAVRADQRVLLVVATVVTAGLLAVHLAWFAPMVRAEAASPGDSVSVMTANLLLGRADVADVLVAARSDDVSLLVLEEMRPAALERLEAAGVDGLFPFRAGDPTDTMIFSRSPLSDPVPVMGGTGSWAVTWNGLRVFAVHSADPRRNAAWRRDLAALAAAASRERPDLMLGDFNATADHRPLRRLLDVGYRDAAEQAGAGWQPTWPARGSRPLGVPLPPSVAIDHVLVSDAWSATRTRTVAVGGSDHKALIAQVTPAGSARADGSPYPGE